MCDKSRRDSPFRHIPQLLHADAIDLRIETIEPFFLYEMFGERTACPFGEHSNLRAKLVTWSEVVLGAIVLVASFILGDDSGDSIAFVDKLRAGKLREDVYARRFDQPAQPLHQLAERDHIIAVIAQWRRRDGQLPRSATCQEINSVIRDDSIKRRRRREVRNEFGEAARIENGAGKLVCTEFASLLEDINVLGRKFRFAAGF